MEGEEQVLPGLGFGSKALMCAKRVTLDKWQNKNLLSERNPDRLAWRESSCAHAVVAGLGRLGFWSGRRTDAA